MRTNIVIDDELMEKAMKASKSKTKKGTVEEGLQLLVRRNKQKAVKKLRGKLHWEGNLDELRSDHK